MTKARQWTVYGLIDPRVPRAIRYIGVTTDLRRRERQHRYQLSADKMNSGLREWKDNLRKAGVGLLAIPLETHQCLESTREAERYFIRELRSQGTHGLLNIHSGGAWCSDTTKSPEHRAKMSISQRLRFEREPMSPEIKAKIAAASKGRKLTTEQRTHLSIIHMGIPQSPETRAKISVSNRGHPERVAKWQASHKAWQERNPMTAEHLAKLHAGHKVWREAGGGHGRQCTPETHARLSEAQRLRHQRAPVTAETKAKMSAAHKGQRPSVEAKAKMSEARRAYWEAKRRKEIQ